MFPRGVTNGKVSATVVRMTPQERRAWGPVVHLAIKDNHLNREALAAKAGVSRPTLRKVENSHPGGDYTPHEDSVRPVLAALGLLDDMREPDVTLFLSRLRPYLARLDKADRDKLMPAIVQLVADALDVSDAVRPTRRSKGGPLRDLEDGGADEQ